MKKSTIASIALLVSATNAHALVGPIGNGGGNEPAPVEKKYCISINNDGQGGLFASTCDETAANKIYRRKVGANGCAEGQAVVYTTEIEMRSCPTMIQL